MHKEVPSCFSASLQFPNSPSTNLELHRHPPSLSAEQRGGQQPCPAYLQAEHRKRPWEVEREKHCIIVAIETGISTITIVLCFKAPWSPVLTPSPSSTTTFALSQQYPTTPDRFLGQKLEMEWQNKNTKSG